MKTRNFNTYHTLTWLFASTVFAISSATAQSINEDFKLTASDAAASDFFGNSVSISGDTALLGAVQDSDAGSLSGSAYLFVRDGSGVWTQQAKLTATDAAAGDTFGISVSIFGDTALVGSRQDDDAGTSSGSVYVFTRNGGVWTQQAKLTATDAAAGDFFGGSVSLSGDTALVGAVADDDGGTDSGSAYIFTRTGGVWTQQAKLTASDAGVSDFFGSSVSLAGDTALVGSRFDDDGGTDSGSAYIFTRTGGVWTQQVKLTASDAGVSDFFGSSVSLAGDTALVTAPFDDDGGTDSSSTFVFTRSGGVWTQQTKLTASDAAAGDGFGVSVSAAGDTAIVGAHLDNDGGGDSGSAYVFELDITPPAFTNIAADPASASDGEVVTITFDASETLSANPMLTVNTNPASFVSESALTYTYSYTVTSGDPIAAATIEITGQDLASNIGIASNNTALTIVEVQSVPLFAWPGIVALAATGALALRRRKK